jgi:hypothetical protein
LRADIVCYKSVVLNAVSIMSSTQSNKYTVSAPRQKMNKEVSDLASTNPKVRRYMANRLYQSQGTSFSP